MPNLQLAPVDCHAIRISLLDDFDSMELHASDLVDLSVRLVSLLG
jgi:hypothetical protein